MFRSENEMISTLPNIWSNRVHTITPAAVIVPSSILLLYLLPSAIPTVIHFRVLRIVRSRACPDFRDLRHVIFRFRTVARSRFVGFSFCYFSGFEGFWLCTLVRFVILWVVGFGFLGFVWSWGFSWVVGFRVFVGFSGVRFRFLCPGFVGSGIWLFHWMWASDPRVDKLADCTGSAAVVLYRFCSQSP